MSFSETITADGVSGEFIASGNFRVHLSGTFGGGTITLQQRMNSGFEDLQDTPQTAISDYILESLDVNAGVYRFNVTGSTTPSLNATVFGSVKTI
tara:strand:+ start:14006 stop:14290 length:285 start_codon:yes stop_codon:yes gene_type:complete